MFQYLNCWRTLEHYVSSSAGSCCCLWVGESHTSAPTRLIPAFPVGSQLHPPAPQGFLNQSQVGVMLAIWSSCSAVLGDVANLVTFPVTKLAVSLISFWSQAVPLSSCPLSLVALHNTVVPGSRPSRFLYFSWDLASRVPAVGTAPVSHWGTFFWSVELSWFWACIFSLSLAYLYVFLF